MKAEAAELKLRPQRLQHEVSVCDPGVCHLLRPVRQPAEGSGDDSHSGTGDLPGLVPSVCRAAAQAPRSGDSSHFIPSSPHLITDQ